MVEYHSFHDIIRDPRFELVDCHKNVKGEMSLKFRNKETGVVKNYPNVRRESIPDSFLSQISGQQSHSDRKMAQSAPKMGRVAMEEEDIGQRGDEETIRGENKPETLANYETGIGRELRPPTMGVNDAFTLLVQDHNRLIGIYEDLLMAREEHVKRDLMRELVLELIKHASIEEYLIYPLLEYEVSGLGKRMRVDSEHEHYKIKERLARLYSLQNYDQTSKQLLDQVIAHFKSHVAKEEREILPALQDKMDYNQITLLTKIYKDARTIPSNKLILSETDLKVPEELFGFVADEFERLKNTFSLMH
jgi:hemerythrin